MSKILLVVAVVAVLAHTTWGYSGGAPEEVCDDMTPKHPAEPQSSEMPYTALPDKKTVKGGDAVKITISGKNPFKGFLLEVRDGDKAVGQFNVDAGDKFVKTINCHGNKNSAATHKNSADKNDLVIEWIAPNEKKSYTIYVTVAENGGVYWVHKKQANIEVE